MKGVITVIEGIDIGMCCPAQMDFDGAKHITIINKLMNNIFFLLLLKYFDPFGLNKLTNIVIFR
jgi:hypothetical protein